MAKRLTPGLRRLVLHLPMADRLALLAELRQSVQEPARYAEGRLDYLADKMLQVSGVDVRKPGDRSNASVWPRYIFILIARQEGYSQSVIGKLLGRDHSSVCHGEQRMRTAFSTPAAYECELNLYNKFIEAL